jgi:FkbM family methyltransferase
MLTLKQAREQIERDYNLGLYDRALLIANEILKQQPHDPVALFFAGKVYRAKHDAERCWNAFRTLSLTFPHNNVYFDLACEASPSAEHQTVLTQDRNKLAEGIAGFPKKPALQLVSNPVGKMAIPMYPDTDIIAQAIKRGEIFEEYIIQEARQYIRPGTACIDIGANFGQMSLIFSKLVGESGAVYSVEADDYCQHIIENNINLNNISNINLVKAAAHKLDNQQVRFPDQDFHHFGTYGSYGIEPKSTDGRVVNTITIDSLKIPLEVSFMKVDIQGADLWALQGAVKTIHKYKFPIIFEYEEQFQESFDTSFDDYVNFVKDINYKFVKTVAAINFLIAPK